MLVVIATLPGKPDQRERIEKALIKTAVATRAESGCTGYGFHRDLEDENSYVSVETWTDQAALDAHFHTPHLVELLGMAGELLAGPPVIVTYETSGPTG